MKKRNSCRQILLCGASICAMMFITLMVGNPSALKSSLLAARTIYNPQPSFSVSVDSKPYMVGTSVPVSVGEAIEFTGTEKIQDIQYEEQNKTFEWQWDQAKLDCSSSAYNTLTCKAVATGDTQVTWKGVIVPQKGTVSRYTATMTTSVAVAAVQVPSTVSLATTPAAQDGALSVTLGETFEAKRSVEPGTGTIVEWDWVWDQSKLDCEPYPDPDVDSDTVRCEAASSGTSEAYIKIYPTYDDGSSETVESNRIQVTVTEPVAETPVVQQEPATDQAAATQPVTETPAEQISQTEPAAVQEAPAEQVSEDPPQTVENKIDVPVLPKEPTQTAAEVKKTEIKEAAKPKTIEAAQPKVIAKLKPAAPPAGYEDTVVVATRDNPFSDTDMNTLEGVAAKYLYEHAIIGGYPDGEFKGGRPVNRAEAAKFLLLASDRPLLSPPYNSPFPDVPNDLWYTKFVVTAADLGIINGYPDGTFRPANTVLTVEFLKMFTGAFHLPKGIKFTYLDVSTEDWFGQYAGVAKKYKLFPAEADLSPRRTSYLLPGNELTRNEVAVAIYQYLVQKELGKL